MVITNLFIIPSGGDIIGHFFVVTQQHSVYSTLHYLQTVEVLYIVLRERLVCFYVVSWCTLSRVRGRRLVCFYVVCLLVYSEQWVWGRRLVCFYIVCLLVYSEQWV